MPGTASSSGFGSLAQTGFWLCWSDGTDAINASQTDCLAGHRRIRTGESVRYLPDWNYGLSCPEVDAGGAAETGDSSPTPKCGKIGTQRSCCHRNGDLTPNRAQETSGHPSDLVLLALV